MCVAKRRRRNRFRKEDGLGEEGRPIYIGADGPSNKRPAWRSSDLPRRRPFKQPPEAFPITYNQQKI